MCLDPSDVNERFPQFSGEWNLEKILQDLGDKTYFEPDYTVKMVTDLRCLECTAEAYIVLRYLTQELEKCTYSEHYRPKCVLVIGYEKTACHSLKGSKHEPGTANYN